MRVRVRLFAGTREAVGDARLEVDLAQGARVRDLFARIAADHPRLAAYERVALFAVDGAAVLPDAPLRDGAEVAIMPPVSGGSGLHEGPLTADDAVRQLRTDGAGAVVAFLGLVRPTSRERPDARIARLAFEAHEELAPREIARVVEEARAKFAIVDAVVLHRVGELALGETIVAVATSAAHRAAAFEAASWIMEELKSRVPIWKQEVAEDGARAWVNDPTTTTRT